MCGNGEGFWRDIELVGKAILIREDVKCVSNEISPSTDGERQSYLVPDGEIVVELVKAVVSWSRSEDVRDDIFFGHPRYFCLKYLSLPVVNTGGQSKASFRLRCWLMLLLDTTGKRSLKKLCHMSMVDVICILSKLSLRKIWFLFREVLYLFENFDIFMIEEFALRKSKINKENI